MIEVKQFIEDNVKVYKYGRLVFDSLHPRHEWHPTLADLTAEEKRQRSEEIEALCN
jgi:hypothetical protein